MLGIDLLPRCPDAQLKNYQSHLESNCQPWLSAFAPKSLGKKMKLTSYNSIKSRMQMSTNAAMNQDSESLKELRTFTSLKLCQFYVSLLCLPPWGIETHIKSKKHQKALNPEAETTSPGKVKEHLLDKNGWTAELETSKPKVWDFPLLRMILCTSTVYLSLSLYICIYCICIYALFFL